VNLSATLTEVEMNLRQVLKLKPGDIIPIKMPDTVSAKIENIPMFKCTFGEHGDKAALKITEFIKRPKDTTPNFKLLKGKSS
jgi:flagellar motor switch protein FliM